jgi:hypothetical protein
MKKLGLYCAFALIFIGSSFVYAQDVLTEIKPISTSIEKKVVEAMPEQKCFAPGRNLGFGDGIKSGRGEEVKKLQQHLIDRGHMSGSATGYFGAITLSAVKKLQKEEGVNQTGYVGPLTLEKIKNRCNTPIMVCDYAAPPEGCMYVACPKYDKQSQCGMVLKCGENVSYEPPANCKSWYDGCNTCGRGEPGGPAYCTKKACPADMIYMQSAKCHAYFDTKEVKTCSAFGKAYKEGQSTDCIEVNGQKSCIADATHVCRSGVWNIEGNMPPVKPFPIKPTEPIACTMEARLCADGSMMPRGSDCRWYPEKCPASTVW